MKTNWSWPRLLITVALFAGLTYGFGLYRSSHFMGTNTRLVYAAQAGYGKIEIRKAYPKKESYWLFGPEPHTVGYYVTYSKFAELPPEGSVLVRYDYRQPERFEVKMETSDAFDLLFDGVLVLQYRAPNWMQPEKKK